MMIETLDLEDFDIPEEKRDVLQNIANGNNVFITGSAGTGKSYLLKLIKEIYNPYGFALTASTGISAVQIGGITIHSWAGIGKGDAPREQIIEHLDSFKGSKQRKQIRAVRILAIDEVSMISADTFELLDYVLRYVRRVDAPFGGIQLILLGDFLQLPPISQAENYNRFCFESVIWYDLKIKICELKQIYRQQDQRLVDLLNNLRFGMLTADDKLTLESRMDLDHRFLAIKPTILTTHNYLAEEANQMEISSIHGKSFSFEQQVSGVPARIVFLQKYCLAPVRLELKIGAQVMMIRNSYFKNGVTNGSIGIVRDFTGKGLPIVEFDNNTILKVQPSEWEYAEFNPNTMQTEVKAMIRQLPLIHAWSITVHKSQGMTIDSILCDLGRLFEQGQSYVALSRVRSLSGLFMKSFDFNKVKAAPKAVEFYKSI
jgi:ATP-dependent DNA helicase PIF1